MENTKKISNEKNLVCAIAPAMATSTRTVEIMPRGDDSPRHLLYYPMADLYIVPSVT